MISLGSKDLIKAYLFKKLPEESFNPYFYALINGDDIDKISSRLGKLPGVNKSEVINRDLLASELTDLLSFYDLDLEFDYSAIKVTFDKNLKNNGQELVRKYLIRLAGLDRVVAGDIKRDDVFVEKRGYLVGFLKKWGEVVMAVTLSIFWILFWYMLSSAGSGYSYLLEQYAKRRLVLLKIMLSGISFFAIISCVAVYLLVGFFSWPFGVLLLFIFMVNLFNGRKLIWPH
jgi:hypothetical protein